MATDYKIVVVPDTGSSAPSVWDYNYYVLYLSGHLCHRVHVQCIQVLLALHVHVQM